MGVLGRTVPGFPGLDQSLTQAAGLEAAPQPVGQTLAYVGAHQGVPCVAGEDGCGPEHCQRPDLVPIRRGGQAATRDN